MGESNSITDEKNAATQVEANEVSKSESGQVPMSAKNGLSPVVSFTKDNIGSPEVITSFTSHGHKYDITGDVDSAMKYAITNESEGGVAYDKAADKKLLRKIDLFLLPLTGLLYAVQFMDKTSLSIAAVLDLKIYFKMEGDMYSWCGSAFYLGYLIFEFPATMILQRFPVAKTTATFIIIWGFIICMHAVAKNYAGFVVLRVLLGVFESAVTPAMVIITGQWYRKEEQFLRTACWFACNGAGTIIGSAIGYGIATHMDSYSIVPFKVLFLAMGAMTIVIGILFFFHIPDEPTKAWFLKPIEKKMVVERIRDNQQGFGNKHFKKYQFIEALKDPITWLMALFELASDIPNGALTNFGSLLLVGQFGYSVTDTMLMGMPQGAVEVVGCIVAAYMTPLVRHRHLMALIGIGITLIASCLLAWAPKKAALSGLYLFGISPLGMIAFLSVIASNCAGHTKKVTVNAIFLIGYCVGNLIGPQTFLDREAPNYNTGKITIVAMYVVSFILIAIIYYIYYRRNIKKQRAIDEQTEDVKAVANIENHEFADMTDFENPYFKYSL